MVKLEIINQVQSFVRYVCFDMLKLVLIFYDFLLLFDLSTLHNNRLLLMSSKEIRTVLHVARRKFSPSISTPTTMPRARTAIFRRHQQHNSIQFHLRLRGGSNDSCASTTSYMYYHGQWCSRAPRENRFIFESLSIMFLCKFVQY